MYVRSCIYAKFGNMHVIISHLAHCYMYADVPFKIKKKNNITFPAYEIEESWCVTMLILPHINVHGTI